MKNLFEVGTIITSVEVVAERKYYGVDTDVASIPDANDSTEVRLLVYGESAIKTVTVAELSKYRAATEKEARGHLIRKDITKLQSEYNMWCDREAEYKATLKDTVEADEKANLERKIKKAAKHITTLHEQITIAEQELHALCQQQPMQEQQSLPDTEIKKEENKVSKNNYTVDLVNGEPIVIVNKSGKQYSADKGKGLTDMLEMVKDLQTTVTDVTAKYEASKEWFKANVLKDNNTGSYVVKHDKPEAKPQQPVADSNNAVTPGTIDYNTKKVDKSKLQPCNLVRSCIEQGITGIDPWSGREVTANTIMFLDKESNMAHLPLCFHGIVLDFENQKNIRAGRPLVTRKEVAERRRKGIYAAQRQQSQQNANAGQPV